MIPRSSGAAALVIALVSLLQSGSPAPAAKVNGRVVDAVTRAPVSGAVVTVGSTAVRTGADGRFTLDVRGAQVVHSRAAGYLRADTPFTAAAAAPEIRLIPFRPKALYLTVYGIGSRQLRNAALGLIDTTELNALVIDIKGDRGLVPYRSAIPLASAAGAQRVITIPNLGELVMSLRQRGIYSIARIVLFKDDLVAEARPALAIRRANGSVFRDREGLAWTNPYNREVWDYNVAIAVEAARAGFDEIQFDYARLPDVTGLTYDRPWTEPNRVAAIDGFFAYAREALTPYNVFLSIDVFGYVCWNRNDTRIGQKLEHLVDEVDYVSPMLYPSGFQFGIPGYRNPVEHPYQIVRLSLDEARRRTSVPPAKFRPWLQAFRDYAFGGRPFTAGEVRMQIKAAEDFGADGWMIWNPRNQYSAKDFTPATPQPQGAGLNSGASAQDRSRAARRD